MGDFQFGGLFQFKGKLIELGGFLILLPPFKVAGFDAEGRCGFGMLVFDVSQDCPL